MKITNKIKKEKEMITQKQAKRIMQDRGYKPFIDTTVLYFMRETKDYILTFQENLDWRFKVAGKNLKQFIK